MTVHMESLGLQGSHGPYLMTISKIPGSSMKEVSAFLMVDKSITTRTVGTLIDAGFVSNDSEDARRYSLTLTEKGRAAVKMIEEISDELWKDLLSDLTEEEMIVFYSVVSKIKARLNEEAEN